MPEPTLRTVEVLNCPQCGMPLAAEAKKCGQCGRDLSNYPRSGATSQVSVGARFATYVSSLVWIGGCFAWAWSYLSNYLKGNFFPPTLNDRDHAIYIASAVASGIIILFLLWTTIGMARYRKAPRKIGRILSWFGSVIGTLVLVFTFTVPLDSEIAPSSNVLTLIFGMACALIFFSFLTRWAIKRTTELEIAR